MTKEFSPFTPGNPVPTELFVGRKPQIEEVFNYINQTLSGKQENVFLIGDRGIGKSSMASYLRYSSEKGLDMVGVHVFLGGVTKVEDVVHKIFEEIIKVSKGQSWFDPIRNFFGERVKEIGLFGASVSFSPKKDELQDLTRKFPEILNNLLKEIKKHKKGLFIALDDINGLASNKKFANWYKSFADDIATNYEDFPVFMLLIGYPENRDHLFQIQPSLPRVFRIIEIEHLSDKEVSEFFTKAFGAVNTKIDKEALANLTRFSSGLPIMMHELGDATFWSSQNKIISEADAFVGILNAADSIGKKYLDPKVYRAIRSERYKSILRKIGGVSRHFTKKDMEAKLSEQEKKVFHNFLKKMRELGIIEQDTDRERGAYKFVNDIYPVYIYLESSRTAKKH